MISAWRICKSKHSSTAFNGYGARLNGGRWNSPGMSVVYTSAVASQAFLEMLVHADSTIISLSYVLIPVEFDKSLVTQLDNAALPEDWRENQAATRALGDKWLSSSTSAVMSVPSATLNVDRNYLVNPDHPDARRLKIGSPQPLVVDERIKSWFAFA